MNYAIAVIDIGMTNKKVAVYDDGLRQLEADYRSFPPVMVEGLQTHDLEGMETWFLDRLAAAAAKYPVRAIAVSTHGATFVCTGENGKAVLPSVYYTHEPGADFHTHFYDLFGSREELQAVTATPAFEAMINPAKGILFAKERWPRDFAKARHLLNYPQYWGARLTGKIGAEGTYVGCHSYLWDWKKDTWSSVADGLGIRDILPAAIEDSWAILGRITPAVADATGLSPDTVVTMGIHDSNSSLLPHFAKKGKTGFILNSTGTWCVIMNPLETWGFPKEELGKVVFFNLSAFRSPVKTAIFLGGQEFETWSKLMMELHGKSELPPYRPELYARILEERAAFILPELVSGSGQFPGSSPRVHERGQDYSFASIQGAIAGSGRGALSNSAIPPALRDFEEGIAVLRISLVLQTLTALERAGIEEGKEIFTEGGFRKNEAYNALLSAALVGNRVFLTDIAEATALGAAMTARMALTGEALESLATDFEVDYREVPKRAIPALEPYRKDWLSLVNRRHG